MTSREIAKFFGDTLQVVSRRSGLAITDRIDPEHAVMFGKTKHDVLLTERITVPVIGKADDVLTLNHGNCFRSL